MKSSAIKDFLVIMLSLNGSLIGAFYIAEWLALYVSPPEIIITTIGLLCGLLIASRFVTWIRTRHAAIILCIGWSFGLFMALILMNSWMPDLPILSIVFSLIHLPALGFVEAWHFLHLPLSGGDEGWWLLWCAPLVQWVFVSIFVLLWQHATGRMPSRVL